jgi:hypothetical protein
MDSICPKCSKYESCKSPCYPVKQLLAEDNLSVYEKSVTKENGQRVSIVFARSREAQQTMLSSGKDKRGDPRLSNIEQQAFSTENGTPFSSFKPELKQTGLFIDRFFHNFTYKDLAVKYDMSATTARKTYFNAVNRLIEVLEAMDKGEVSTKQVDFWRQKVEERSGSLPKGQKWYLLNKLFGLRPSEIAEMEGLDKRSSSVRQLIIRVSDQLKAGELSLLEVSPEESAEAKARLDTVRKKRRERRARKKAHIE